MDWQQIGDELAKDLDPANVKPPRQYGPKGHYIEGWWAIAEANRIFGFNGWSDEILSLACVSEKPRKIGREGKDGWGVTYSATVRVTVDGVTKDGSGAGHGYDVDLGLAHESAMKEAETDAFKRAIRKFGWPFGLALYDKDRAHVGHGTNADIRDPAPEPAKPDRDAETRTLIDGAVSLDGLETARGRIREIWSGKVPRWVGVAFDTRKAEIIATLEKDMAE